MNAQEASKIACDKIYADNKETIDSIMKDIELSASNGCDSINVIRCNYVVTYKIKYYFEKLGYRFNIFNDNGFDINW